MTSTLVIAECGSCHDGSLGKAFALIDAAKEAGADVAKFQFWSSPDRLAANRNAPSYLDIYARYQVPAIWLPALKDRCDRVGLEFLCTAYLLEDLPVIAPLVPGFKVSSFEAGDHVFLSAHGPLLGREKILFVSFGMSTVRPSVVLRRAFPPRQLAQIRTLHCVSAYPAPTEALSLAMLRSPEFDGFSDHSDPRLTISGALAVAAGATVLEAHLRLDETNPKNPDAPHAMNPQQFAEYVRLVRFAEIALGDGAKRIHESETPMTAFKVTA